MLYFVVSLFSFFAGELVESEESSIKLDNVPIITPNRDVVVSSLTVEVSKPLTPFYCHLISVFNLLGTFFTYFLSLFVICQLNAILCYISI